MTEQLNIIRVQAHEKYKIDDIVVETLKSTDEGVAFIVSEKDGTIYHALGMRTKVLETKHGS